MALTARFPIFLGCVIIITALSLTGATMDARAQSAPTTIDAPSADPQKEIAVAPDARDTEIALRLQKILDASGWFNPVTVSVREGLVFLDGQTETDERKEWARQLALRTQDVVAVVNRVEVKPQVSWDLTPAWREVVHLSDQAKRFAPIAVVSLIILLVFWFLSRGVAAFSRRVLRHRIPSPLLLQIVARTLAIPVFLIGLYLVLQVAGLTRLAITVIGGTGLIGIVIGLAFREIAENALASLLLSVRNPFRTGDWIQVSGFQGIVQNLNMRTTVLLTLDGNHVQIPNALVFSSIITNFSSNPGRRAEFTVGIGYDASVMKAQDIIIKALRAHPAVLEEPEPAALVDELGPSTVNLRVQFWFDGRTYSIFKVRSALMRQVKRALQDAGVPMPDTAREVIFPEGLEVHGGAAQAPETGARPAPPLPVASGDTVVATSGEGDLVSEEPELKRQAAGAELPDAGENLLVSTTSKTGSS
jgi:small conductance mechanosensitive channel